MTSIDGDLARTSDNTDSRVLTTVRALVAYGRGDQSCETAPASPDLMTHDLPRPPFYIIPYHTMTNNLLFSIILMTVDVLGSPARRGGLPLMIGGGALRPVVACPGAKTQDKGNDSKRCS